MTSRWAKRTELLLQKQSEQESYWLLRMVGDIQSGGTLHMTRSFEQCVYVFLYETSLTNRYYRNQISNAWLCRIWTWKNWSISSFFYVHLQSTPVLSGIWEMQLSTTLRIYTMLFLITLIWYGTSFIIKIQRKPPGSLSSSQLLILALRNWRNTILKLEDQSRRNMP